MHHNTPQSVHNRIQQTMAEAQSELKEKLNIKGRKRKPRRNTTQMWGLTPVCLFSVFLFSWSHTAKASSSHCETGLSKIRVNLADAVSHSRLHPSSSTSQYSATALAVLSSPVLRLRTICYIEPVLAFGTEQDIIVNSRRLSSQRSQRSSCSVSVSKSALQEVLS
jgi:hypothetical protein